MPAILCVRAVVPADDHDEFDRWYHEEHLPEATAAFEAQRAWRGWSVVEDNVHYAYYMFDSAARAEAVSNGDAMQAQKRNFDARWGERVTRTREIVDVAQWVDG